IATVTSAAGGVNEGSATFTIQNGVATIGSPVTVNVVGGVANANYVLPAGTSIGSYTIKVVYNATSNYVTSNDGTHLLSVTAAPTITAVSNASVGFNSLAQN